MENSIFFDIQNSISPIAHPQEIVLSTEGNNILCIFVDLVKAFLNEIYTVEWAIDAGLPPPLIYCQSDFAHGKYLKEKFIEFETASQLWRSRNDSKRPSLNYYFDPVIENKLLTQSQFMFAKMKILERQKEQMRRKAVLEVRTS